MERIERKIGSINKGLVNKQLLRGEMYRRANSIREPNHSSSADNNVRLDTTILVPLTENILNV